MLQRRALGESTAEHYLELLAARGIRYFIRNGGTDFEPQVVMVHTIAGTARGSRDGGIHCAQESFDPGGTPSELAA